MEAHVVSLILSIRNCATDPYAWLSASSSRVLWIQWLVVVLSQKNQLLVHIKRNHTYRTISEMLNFSFIGTVNQPGNFPRLNMTRCHCVVVKWLRVKVYQCCLLLVQSWLSSKSCHVITLGSNSMIVLLLSKVHWLINSLSCVLVMRLPETIKSQDVVSFRSIFSKESCPQKIYVSGICIHRNF